MESLPITVTILFVVKAITDWHSVVKYMKQLLCFNNNSMAAEGLTYRQFSGVLL